MILLAYGARPGFLRGMGQQAAPTSSLARAATSSTRSARSAHSTDWLLGLDDRTFEANRAGR